MRICINNSVCLFIRDSGRNYCTGRHQTLRNYEVGLQKCPPQVEIVSLAVLEEMSFNIRFFSFAADGHFINYSSIDFWLSGGVIRCRLAIKFKLSCCYSSYPLLLTAKILQINLGQTRCCMTRQSRSPTKAGALLVFYSCSTIT